MRQQYRSGLFTTAAGQTSRKQMQKLISELTRLYLSAYVDLDIDADSGPEAASQASVPAREALAQRIGGQSSAPVSLVAPDGTTRAIAIAFAKPGSGDGDGHWTRLCAVANALQVQLGLPAPAVSISGDSAFYLWLSLQTPVPATRLQSFVALLRKAYDPDCVPDAPDAPDAPAAAGQGGNVAAPSPHVPTQLPPFLHAGTGKWAAFINPGLGASFADDAGLEMAPPLAGQAALLEGLESIGMAQFDKAFAALAPALTPAQALAAAAAAPAPAPACGPAGAPAAGHPGNFDSLLLRDATLEDIVRFLHARHIEPTFRHLLPGPPR